MLQKQKEKSTGGPSAESSETDEAFEAAGLIRKAKKLSDEVEEFRKKTKENDHDGLPCPICGVVDCPSWGIP